MNNEELLNAAMKSPPAYLGLAPVAQSASKPVAPIVGVGDKGKLPTAGPVEEFDRAGNRIVARVGHLDVRQSERLPPGYKARAVGEMSFDPRLAYEIALDLDSAVEVFKRYGYDESAAVKLSIDSVFAKTVKAYKDEIAASGIGFKLKAKIQAEDLLTHSYQIATDPDVPASVRADLIKWTAKVAGYEPKEDNGGGKGGGSFALNVTFAGLPAVTLSSSEAERTVSVITQEGE